MNIFYVAAASANNPILPRSKIWEINLKETLLQMGHRVIEPSFDSGEMSLQCMGRIPDVDPVKARTHYSDRIFVDVKRAHHSTGIDLLFSYFYSAMILPEAIQAIAALGIVTVNWYCTASYQFHLVEEIAPAYDYCLMPEKSRLDDYRRVGANPIYCQEAANPNIYKPYPLPREFDVVFVGGKYGDRPQYIRYLFDKGIAVCVWGSGWQELTQESTQISQQSSCPSPASRLAGLRTVEGWRRAGRKVQRRLGLLPPPDPPVTLPPEICGPPLSDEDMIKMYSRSKISLGFSSCGSTHLTRRRILQVRLRDFEAPMSGAFYMVEYMGELEEFFEIGKEIVCYHDKADLADKIKYYLAHDAEREAIRQAGYWRAVSEHTWQRRFQMVFETIGLG